MERPERYDPEDIERLLQERGFDELLAEERAYVLRHLSGREEYEAMRALLNQVRGEERRRTPMQADDAVRAHVMRAYRQEHRPAWRIWLNSLGALMLPRESAMPLLRPALAIASLALLVTAGVWVARNAGDGPAQRLAELKAPAPKASDAPAPQTAVAEAPPPPDAAEAAPITEAAPTGLAAQQAEAREAVAARSETLAKRAMAVDAPEEEAAAPGDERIATRLADAGAGERANADDAVRREDVAAAAPRGRVVTEAEIGTNQSLANATGKVSAARKAEGRPAHLGTVADMPELLALMAAGW